MPTSRPASRPPRTKQQKARLVGQIVFTVGMLATMGYAGFRHHAVEAVALLVLYILWYLVFVASE